MLWTVTRYKEILVLISRVRRLLSAPVTYLETQQALQWWSRRQSIQLCTEAEKIRNGLLQESFTLRRSLELSLLDDSSDSNRAIREWLKKVEEFHASLEQLSDRLYPTYLEDSLPLAIQSVVEPWQAYHANLTIEMKLPAQWRHEQSDRGMVILRTLDELLRINLSEISNKTSMLVYLKSYRNLGELSIHLSCSDISKLVSYSSSKELKYLSQTFQVLTSGECFCRVKDLTLTWYLRWQI